MSKFSEDETAIASDLVSVCYWLSQTKDDQEIADAVAAKMIEDGTSDIEVGTLAAFIERILGFYASDEATPLLESAQQADYPPPPAESSDCPFDVDDGEPSDLDLAKIESEVENLWETVDDSKPSDFSFSGSVIRSGLSLDESDDEEPDYSGMTRRERKRLKKLRRAQGKQGKQRRNEDYGFDKFELAAASSSSPKKFFEDKIYYDFDTQETAAETATDDDIGLLLNSNFEEKKEKKVFSAIKPAVNFNNYGETRFLPNSDLKPAFNNSNTFKRKYEWDDNFLD